MLITADGGYRRGEVFALKPQADEAVAATPTIEHVVVVRRGGENTFPRASIDHECGSCSSKSIGVMRTILSSFT